MIVGITVLLIIVVAGIFLTGFKAGYKECLQDISEENENPYLATIRKIRTIGKVFQFCNHKTEGVSTWEIKKRTEN